MDVAGQRGLAGSGLALQQDRRAGRRGLGGLDQSLPHGRALAGEYEVVAAPGGPPHLGQFLIGTIVQHCANLRIISSHCTACMKVDAVIDKRDDLMGKIIGYSTCQRAIFASRKGTINVLSIRHITREVKKSIHIRDGHAYNGPPCYFMETLIQYSPHNLHPVNFITVHSGR